MIIKPISMDHFVIIDERLQGFLHTELFPSIFKGEVVLFLGAGASVTEKKFLGSEVITYYQDQLAIDAETNDLVEFMDLISSMQNFHREDFDNYIVRMLSKLNPTETHKVLASLNWNQIITTNVDLIIERAYDLIENTPMVNKTLKYTRNLQESHNIIGNSSLKYIKLNGCISNKNKYPLIFSSKDFEYARSYHKVILKGLSDMTSDIKFLTIGYSFSDPFSKFLINHFDSFNFRHKKPIYCIDPYVPDSRLPFLKEQGIIVIKLTNENLFDRYKKWEEEYSEKIVKRKGISFNSRNNIPISIPNRLKVSLGNSVVQLSDHSKIKSFHPEVFYQGEKPTYDVIRRNYDVVKSEKLQEIKNRLTHRILKNGNKLIPVFFLSGMFGSGKSTFLYRIIHELIHDNDLEAVAFECQEINMVRVQDIGELFSLTEAKNIFITFQEIELDSCFKEMMELRNKLSVEQFTNFNIFFIVSIRENIYQKFLKSYKYDNVEEINIDSAFNATEAEQLIEKLSENRLIRYRDINEKKALINKVVSEYDGDTFISLISLVTKTNFEDILYSAYLQLTKEAKEAFIYTSLLYQYKILMPSGLLMKLVSKDWKTFENEILRYDSKNILIQEIKEVDLHKELYLRTKHPLISENLVNRILKSKDEKFEKLRRIISHMVETDPNAKMFVNLIKSLRYYNHLDEDKINKLYDIADSIFDSHPHFILHYSINLQFRKKSKFLIKAISKIRYAESHLDGRNHFLTHRRAVLNYELAKVAFKEEKELIKTLSYIEEARELFEVKRVEDPFSSYSYVDYINLELWVLNNLKLTEKELLKLHIRIHELFDIAFNAVFENVEKLFRLKAKYYNHLESSMNSNKTVEQYLDDLYENDETRPYALVLKYNYLLEKHRKEESKKLLPELEYYIYNDEVAKLLFTIYGRSLYILENRTKFFSLIKGGYDFKNKDKLRYHFYSYIAESYNRNFSYSYDHLREISTLGSILNPDLHELWLSDNELETQFLGTITSNRKGFIQIRVSELQQNFRLMKDSIKQFQPKINDRYKVKLHFFIQGIRAELLYKE